MAVLFVLEVIWVVFLVYFVNSRRRSRWAARGAHLKRHEPDVLSLIAMPSLLSYWRGRQCCAEQY
jgi:hypothetical protein